MTPYEAHLSQHYTIVVQGHMDERWARWFHGMSLSRRPGGQTVLSGEVVDQAALRGMLSRILDLGLPLLFVRRGDFQPED